MSTVELRFSALPSHVRTARLVAAAVARRAGVDESVLDEVRLAVGEACSRAVGLHRRHRPDEPVTVTLIQEATRFSIEVSDCVPAAEDPAVAGLGLGITAATEVVPDSGTGLGAVLGEDSADLLSGSMGLAVISGLVDELDVRAGVDGAVIRMTWPAGG